MCFDTYIGPGSLQARSFATPRFTTGSGWRPISLFLRRRALGQSTARAASPNQRSDFEQSLSGAYACSGACAWCWRARIHVCGTARWGKRIDARTRATDRRLGSGPFRRSPLPALMLMLFALFSFILCFLAWQGGRGPLVVSVWGSKHGPRLRERSLHPEAAHSTRAQGHRETRLSDDDVLHYLGERLKIEGKTENRSRCATESIFWEPQRQGRVSRRQGVLGCSMKLIRVDQQQHSQVVGEAPLPRAQKWLTAVYNKPHTETYNADLEQQGQRGSEACCRTLAPTEMQHYGGQMITRKSATEEEKSGQTDTFIWTRLEGHG